MKRTQIIQQYVWGGERDAIVQYSEKFRRMMVQKLANPEGPSAGALAEEVGVSQSTLSRWLREAGRIEKRNGNTISTHTERTMMAKRPQDWSSEEKLNIIIEAASVSEEELGAFLRRKGLHKAQLEQWRSMMLSGLTKQPGRSSKKSPEARKIRALEKELNRKEKALAEAAALLVLQKKAQALLGGEDDDTKRSNGK